ncbi:hypothetical protein CR513_18942, partial [Mucuna pruriens]
MSCIKYNASFMSGGRMPTPGTSQPKRKRLNPRGTILARLVPSQPSPDSQPNPLQQERVAHFYLILPPRLSDHHWAHVPGVRLHLLQLPLQFLLSLNYRSEHLLMALFHLLMACLLLTFFLHSGHRVEQALHDVLIVSIVGDCLLLYEDTVGQSSVMPPNP